MDINILEYISYLENKFWQKVNIINDDNSCWEWTKEKDKWGYGVIHIYKKTKRLKRICASKASWVIQNKTDVPKGMLVCHKCDNRACVRPDHLFLGTFKDNMQYCKIKGRLSKKERKRKNPFKKYQNIEERFLSKIDKINECWMWKSSKDKNGYGVFLYQGKAKPAHRISWYIFIGDIPETICHKCDNRLCVNPSHLFVGNQKDNALNCVKKRRTIAQNNPEKILKGENHGNAKLSNETVLNIVKDKLILSIDNISKKYNLTENYILRILQGKIWNSITNIPKYQTKRKYRKN